MEKLRNSEDYDIAVSKACLSGDIVELQQLIENGVDINVRDRSRYITRFKGFSVPVIFNAVEKQHVEVVRLLLKHGANVHNVDKFGRSALHIACTVGNIGIVNLLLDYGANVNHKNSNRQRSIHVAAMYGFTEIVRTLLNFACSVNINDMQGCTPLYCAVESGHSYVVDILLKHTAVIHMDIETYNNSPLQIGFQNFHLAAVQQLLVHHDKLRPEEVGQIVSKIHFCAFLGETESVLKLLDFGFSINSQDVEGRTLLHVACKMCYSDLVHLCLSRGIDVNMIDNKGLTALHYVCEGNCKRFHSIQHVDDMLEDNPINSRIREEDLNKIDPEMQTKIAKILIDNGADINPHRGPEKIDWSPLCHACYNGNTNLIKLLIYHGAGINEGNERLPLLTAISSRHPQVVKLLIENNADVNRFGSNFDKSFSPLHLAVHFGLEDVAALLLDAGANANIRDDNTDSTPLSLIQRRSVPLCDLLIRKGADPNLMNKYGDTPLHDACRLTWEDVDLVKRLLEGGADINSLNQRKRLPLHNACEKGHSKIIMTLLQSGSKINVQDTRDTTPLMLLLENYLALTKTSSSHVINAMIPLLNASCPWYLWENHNTKVRKLLLYLYAYSPYVLKVIVPFCCGSPVPITPHKDILQTFCENKDYEMLSLMIESGYRISETDLVESYSEVPSNKQLLQDLFDCPSLQSFCRVSIRGRVYSSLQRGKLLDTQIMSLPIPRKLKDDLLFKHVV